MGGGSIASTILFGVLSLALPVLALVLMIHVLVVSLVRPRRYKPHPACERCGYDVGGLTAFTCPECGSDLRTTGIITPSMEAKRRGSTLGAILAWTVLVATISFIFGNVVFVSVGVRSARAAQAQAAAAATSARGGASPAPAAAPRFRQTTLSLRLLPKSGQYAYIDLEATHTPALADQPAQATISLVLPGPGKGTATLSASSDPASGFNMTDPTGKVVGSGESPTAADLLAWLKAAGADPAATGVSAEADDLAATIAGALGGGAPNASPYSGTAFTGSTVNVSTSPVAATQFVTAFDSAFAIMAIVLGVAALVWIGGLLLIIRRRRRMFAPAAA